MRSSNPWAPIRAALARRADTRSAGTGTAVFFIAAGIGAASSFPRQGALLHELVGSVVRGRSLVRARWAGGVRNGRSGTRSRPGRPLLPGNPGQAGGNVYESDTTRRAVFSANGRGSC